VDWLTRLESPANAIAVLTAMITPAVLISACGTLLLSTSTRLGRVVDRVRVLVEKFEQLERTAEADALHDERRQLIFGQLQRQSARARLLQRALVAFYSALGIFVACSVIIAVIAAIARNLAWIAVGLGLCGALFMLYGAMLLIVESRMALGAIVSELEFVAAVSRHYGDDLQDERVGGPFTWLGRKIG
jgi:Protein of unknown function (DUF2721)